MADEQWFDDYADDSPNGEIDEYDVTATPNDFNVLTLVSFMQSGAVKIPGFQRNFVWDKVRSSKLIESLILGIPVPQLFLYEQEKNLFLVIDGQQRLMSIYYFNLGRFPRKDKRGELRMIFDEHGGIPDHILHDNEFFEDFDLRLSGDLPGKNNKFHGLKYNTLEEYKTQFDLRPVRNIVVRQNSPEEDDSAIYEVFNRLNTGGVNLRPQEIRTSMYHSSFYDVLYRINADKRWRRVLRSERPDLHMKDIEILLRGFAMLISAQTYAPSMVRFLNRFSKQSQANSPAQNTYLEELFLSFLDSTEQLEGNAFINPRNNRFNIALYEAAFAATLKVAFSERRAVKGFIDPKQLADLRDDEKFQEATVYGTTRTSNVKFRLDTAENYLSSL